MYYGMVNESVGAMDARWQQNHVQHEYSWTRCFLFVFSSNINFLVR